MSRFQNSTTGLRCPGCQKSIDYSETRIVCPSCKSSYVVFNGIPILVHEEHSYLKARTILEDFCNSAERTEPRIYKKVIFKILNFSPTIYSRKRMQEIGLIFSEFISEYTIKTGNHHLRILVLGGGTSGNIFNSMKFSTECEVIVSDIYLSNVVDIVCDGTNIPFEDNTFDVILAEGVLEHVIKPDLLVDETHRTLKKNGLVLISTPFMLGVHMPVADYQRWSRLGLIGLFRKFTVVECKQIEGVLVAIAYMISYLMMTLSPQKFKVVTKLLINFLVGFFKYIDPLVRNLQQSEDVCASLYYVGTKSDFEILDYEVNSRFTGLGICPK